MKDYLKFYINGEWVDPIGSKVLEIENPTTQESFAKISLGSAADVDKAVQAAQTAFQSFSQTDITYRVNLLDKICAGLQTRTEEIALAITSEMGAPSWLSNAAQVPAAIGHFMTMSQILKDYKFESKQGQTTVRKEPIGVCGFITPWNWPLNQIACKVAPAIAAGCTIILKPSEISPINAMLFAEVLHEAGVPKGVFNLVNGDGATVGSAISSHPGVDMVSFTGSTGAGVAVAQAAAPTVKRVHQELGGKSPNIVLPSADLQSAVSGSVITMMMNSGQSCNAPSRMLVHKDQYEQAVAIAKATAQGIKVENPITAEPGSLGPISNGRQYQKIQDLIQKGVSEGAVIETGGLGHPEGLDKGYFARPTIFSNVNNDMTIAREEIFGPVMVMIPFENLDHAIEIANDTIYGLAAYIQGSLEEAKSVATKIRAGQVVINGAELDFSAPFGGFKQSGNGREWGAHGFEDFLEIKAVIEPAQQ